MQKLKLSFCLKLPDEAGLDNGGLVLLFIALQIFFMLIMIVLSVFKPRKRLDFYTTS